jgi:ribosomal protein S18 acetylase RimI-like enzyme
LRPEDVPLYRTLRLEALQAHPTAFGADTEEDRAGDLSRMIGRPPAVTLGGFVGGVLAGSAGLIVSDRLKQRHKGQVVGVYVMPARRRTGLARAMIDGLIAHGRAAGLVMLTLSVTADNQAAQRLYRAAGFTVYGREPRSLRVGEAFFDEDLMALALD